MERLLEVWLLICSCCASSLRVLSSRVNKADLFTALVSCAFPGYGSGMRSATDRRNHDAVFSPSGKVT